MKALGIDADAMNFSVRSALRKPFARTKSSSLIVIRQSVKADSPFSIG